MSPWRAGKLPESIEPRVTSTSAKLVTLLGNTSKPERLLDQPCTLVGRGRHSDVRLGSSAVARSQCVLVCDHAQVVLRDISGDGTNVNGNDVRETVLSDDDKIEIGRFRFRIDLSDAPRDTGDPPVEASLTFDGGADSGKRLELSKLATVCGAEA